MSDVFTVPLADFRRACAERDEARKVARMLLRELRDGTIAWDCTEWLMRPDYVTDGLEAWLEILDKCPWLEVSDE